MSDIKTIVATIQKAVDGITSSAAGKQSALLKYVLLQIKRLETRGDTLLNNINNLKLINNIKATLERLIIDDRYKAAVRDFIASYKDVQGLHNEYFAKFAVNEAGVKKGKLAANQQALKILTKTAIDTTIINLTESGLQSGVTEPLRKMLLQNVNVGSSYADLTEQLRTFMLTDKKSEGALERYVKTYSTTAINQFSAEYNKLIADDLGLFWYFYDGSLLATSREFCIQAVKKKYIHASEFETILSGNFDGEQIHISRTTSLPDGLMAGTNENNFVRRRGGWSCGHQMIAVDESGIPQNIRDRLYTSAAYRTWAAKNGKKHEPAI